MDNNKASDSSTTTEPLHTAMDVNDTNEQDPVDNSRIEIIPSACNTIEKDEHDDGKRSFGPYYYYYRVSKEK